MTTNTLAATLVALIAEIGGMSPTEIAPDHRLTEDLGLDSLQSMELLSRITEHYGVDPDLDDVADLETVSDVAGFVEAAVAEGARA